uniref:Transcription elongation factor n=1 Tax=Kalanchoe fedtschenkoi TaxID=63787 RepID=A0A7N0THK4_KALFE
MGGNKEKEIVELFQAAKKAADEAAALSGGAEESRCLDALKLLKDFPVNYQILVSTQVGKQLRSLTKHPRERIRVFASELIDMWKKLIARETEKAKKNGNGIDKVPKPVKLSSTKIQAAQATAKTANLEVVTVKKCSTTEPVQVDMGDQNTAWKAPLRSETYMAVKSDVKIEKDSAEKAKVEQTTKEEKLTIVKKPIDGLVAVPKLGFLVKCHDDMRDKVRESLFEALSKVAGEADEEHKDVVEKSDPVRVAVTVESAMFEKWGRTNGGQRAKYRSVMFNINDSKNPDFRRKVLLGQIPPEKIPTLSAEDMASDERKSKNDEIKRKALLECEREAAPKSTTDQFKCGRCGQRKTTYYQMQTRSADEPMTTFVTCVNCNNHWKFC